MSVEDMLEQTRREAHAICSCGALSGHAAIDRLVAVARLVGSIGTLTDFLNSPGMERWQIENDIQALRAEVERLTSERSERG